MKAFIEANASAVDVIYMQIHGDVCKKKEVADEEVNDKGQIVVVIGIYCIAGNFLSYGANFRIFRMKLHI